MLLLKVIIIVVVVIVLLLLFLLLSTWNDIINKKSYVSKTKIVVLNFIQLGFEISSESYFWELTSQPKSVKKFPAREIKIFTSFVQLLKQWSTSPTTIIAFQHRPVF